MNKILLKLRIQGTLFNMNKVFMKKFKKKSWYKLNCSKCKMSKFYLYPNAINHKHSPFNTDECFTNQHSPNKFVDSLQIELLSSQSKAY